MKLFLLITLISIFAHATQPAHSQSALASAPKAGPSAIADGSETTPAMKAALKRNWLYSAALAKAKATYKRCSLYQDMVMTHEKDRFDNDADLDISLRFSCDQSDTVDVTAFYNLAKHEISNVSVSYMPCTSDMCGP